MDVPVNRTWMSETQYSKRQRNENMKTFFKNTNPGLEQLTRYSLPDFRRILQFLEDGEESAVSGWDYAVEHEGGEGGVKYLGDLSKRERAELRREVMEGMTFQVTTPAVYQHGSDIDVGRRRVVNGSEFLADI